MPWNTPRNQKKSRQLKNPRPQVKPHQRKSKISLILPPTRNQSEVSREFILGQFLTTGSMSLFDWIT